MFCCWMKSTLVMVFLAFTCSHQIALCLLNNLFWWCALRLIKSNCDFSKIVEICDAYCDMQVDGLGFHWPCAGSPFHLGVFNGENIASPHWVVCIIAWLKRWPNILVWLILHGLGQIAMIIETIGTIISTKHLYGKDHMCFVKYIWKTNENAWNITLYQVWPRWLFINGVSYPFVRASFCACLSSVGFPHHFVRLPRTHTHMHVLCMQPWLTFCLCPVPYFGSPQQIHIWKKGFYCTLDLNWLWFGPYL